MPQETLLYTMAIGDAFGMKYEFVEHDIPVSKSDLFFASHPKFLDYQIGHYTDDTQMSLGNAELLLKGDTKSLTQRDFVVAWLEAFRRDPRPGYSKYMFALLSKNPSPEEFVSSINPDLGTAGGAAMRAAPLGLLEDKNEVMRLSRLQARITHNTPAGITSALAVSLSSHYLHHGGSTRSLPSFLDDTLGKQWCSASNGLVDDPNNGLKIVQQALASVYGQTSLSGVLLASVSQSRRADTDTIGAIALAIASRDSTILDDIPQKLHDTLETGPFGAGYLKETDKKLMDRFARRSIFTPQN